MTDDYPAQWYKYDIPWCTIVKDIALSQKMHHFPKQIPYGAHFF